MSLKDIVSTLAQAPVLAQVAREIKPRPLNVCDSFAARMEATAEKFPHHNAIIFEGKTLTWAEINAQANRYAHALTARGLQRGDTVSMVMENRIEFVAALLAMNKLGITAALINSNLIGRPLIHCIKITNSRMCIFGEECQDAIAAIQAEAELSSVENYLYVADAHENACPRWATDLNEESEDESTGNPPQSRDITLGETALNIFTSGTTGLPKASIISNRRFLISAALSYKGGLRCTENDCIYLCLPLYHGTGLFLGAGAAFSTGACMFIRRKFSGSRFLNEVRENGVTCFVYIGELCRYLLNTPELQDDYNNPLCAMMGNGLRPDVWHQFKQRFAVKRIAEFYGSSEGNVGFVNMLNKNCTVGMTSVPIALVKYDVDEDEIVRDKDGHLIEAIKGEAGLLLGKITGDTAFEGYTSKEATESKILRDAFEPGDAWFNTGDLIKTIDVGFALGFPHYQFVDRVGDTYRWKSENVSTNEVGEIINGHPQVHFCNVYGVDIPATEGKAGMVSLTLSPEANDLDLESFSAFVLQQLPSYARPVFVRIQKELDTTGTFKMVKGDLRKTGYDLTQIKEPLYVMKPRSDVYVALEMDFAQQLKAGKAGY